MPDTENTLTTACCICGGGPAGIMLGFLLARAGVKVIVLEKHKDFFRDFRGDTIHPSTMQLMYELGLLEEFLKVPHQEVKLLAANYNGTLVPFADFSKLPVAKPVLGLMPQWDFLKFVSTRAAEYPAFKLMMDTEVFDVIKEGGRVTGVKAKTPDGIVEVKADLIVGTDGRSSTVRSLTKLNVITTGAPIDVVWFRLSQKEKDPEQTLGYFKNGKIMIMLDRGDYWQCAYIINKGGYDQLKAEGLDEFKRQVTTIVSFVDDRLDELKSWDDIKLLSVAIDHLERWFTDGLLCIGDAAHAMSPIGGVGINLAVQDAVAAANILYKPLLKGDRIANDILARVQKRRASPVKVIQKMQVFIQKGVAKRRTDTKLQQKLPLPFRLLKAFPVLRRIPARLVGMGVRPEHIETPDVLKH